MPDLIETATWKRDLAALYDDLLTIKARLILFLELGSEPDERQQEVLVMLDAAIDAPIAHIEARLTPNEINA